MLLHILGPKTPGSRVWVAVSLKSGREHEVDTERATCNCPRWEHKGICDYIAPVLKKARFYSGKLRPEEAEDWVEEVWSHAD